MDAGTDAAVSLPLFGYDGYRASVDGQEMETGLGENNRLTVYLSAGTQGELRVWFAGKAVWRIADAVSLLTAVFPSLIGQMAEVSLRLPFAVCIALFVFAGVLVTLLSRMPQQETDD